ncbi:MAG: EamA family transporter [Patescibacteria group bacterium]|jgi:drug/metabolite transporter (DMT)-like permease
MWFIIAVISFFLLALAALIDKFLLSKTRIVPLAFAFYISLGGILGTVLLFFAPHISFPSDNLWSLFLGGASLFFGLYFMFIAVNMSEVSKANPLIVSFTPLFVFILSLFVGLDLVTWDRILGLILLVVGGYFLSQAGLPGSRLGRKAWLFVILSALMMGGANTFSKIAYNNLPFIEAFVYLRWTTMIIGLLYVTLANQWREVLLANKSKRKEEVKVKAALGIFIFGQVVGSLGVILMQYAVKLGNVIVVTALNGLQFLFILLLIYFFSKFYPRLINEPLDQKAVLQKVFWSLFLVVGVILILI